MQNCNGAFIVSAVLTFIDHSQIKQFMEKRVEYWSCLSCIFQAQKPNICWVLRTPWAFHVWPHISNAALHLILFLFFSEKTLKTTWKYCSIFTSYNSLWSATEGWITVTENIATSNPLQERRLGMKTESPARLLWKNILKGLTLYITTIKTSSFILCCHTHHQLFVYEQSSGFWDHAGWFQLAEFSNDSPTRLHCKSTKGWGVVKLQKHVCTF